MKARGPKLKLFGEMEETQDSLNNRNEGETLLLDCVGTSTSSASRVTELVIVHPPRDGGDPGQIQQQEQLVPGAQKYEYNMPKASIKCTCSLGQSYISTDGFYYADSYDFADYN